MIYTVYPVEYDGGVEGGGCRIESYQLKNDLNSRKSFRNVSATKCLLVLVTM